MVAANLTRDMLALAEKIRGKLKLTENSTIPKKNMVRILQQNNSSPFVGDYKVFTRNSVIMLGIAEHQINTVQF